MLIVVIVVAVVVTVPVLLCWLSTISCNIPIPKCFQINNYMFNNANTIHWNIWSKGFPIKIIPITLPSNQLSSNKFEKDGKSVKTNKYIFPSFVQLFHFFLILYTWVVESKFSARLWNLKVIWFKSPTVYYDLWNNRFES